MLRELAGPERLARAEEVSRQAALLRRQLRTGVGATAARSPEGA